ncbi:hypothetical protein U2F26_21615 [Micromonospora sp. 4G57]|uniref:Uncharacterized protein n=1 Tax=Micromonospora sicca TaxID=2202420 RepID=A0ABU5JF79_9ACTN|nr:MULTISPECIES: hypothetical protein [unclassified Micromonospora]MDZ5445298.1 hypothetical protein [Micromonospora sp. 4G57]MDZ5491059.1 hypothetical protein [Micromonospora sp. 4G53]
MPARLEQLVEDGRTKTLLHAAEADSALGDVVGGTAESPARLPADAARTR